MTNHIRSLLLTAIGAAALFATAGAIAFSGGAPAMIYNVEIGERGLQTRIAIFCDGDCVPEPRGAGQYFLPGAGDRFEIDMSGASDRVSRFQAAPDAAGAALTILHDGAIARTEAKACTVGGKNAACLDLFFEPAKTAAALTTSTDTKAPSAQPVEKKPALTPPPLRETATERFQQFGALAPPERLSPPAAPILAKVQPIEPAITVATPSLRNSEPLAAVVEEDLAGRIDHLLGKNLTPAYCNNAQATLQADAWAQEAMVDLGLCAAARGDAVEAEAILSRILDYTPDNYEALVGRALIAEQAGEKGAALRYFQDALNVPPPIEESKRIVEAMKAIG